MKTLRISAWMNDSAFHDETVVLARFARFSLLAIAMLFMASKASGADLAVYDFTGEPGDQSSSSATYVDADYSFFDVARNTGLTTGPVLPNTLNSTVDFSSAEGDRYVTWWGYKNGSPAPEWEFNFVRTGYRISTGTGTLPTQVKLAYSLDSASSWIDIDTLNLSGTSGDLDFTFSTVAVPSELDFGVTFKLQVIGGSGTDTTFALTNGSFGGLKLGVVPEPSTYALGMIATGVMAILARRKAHKD